ncbi:MAG: PTS mannitol transporter subunit IICBA [Clostridia bacterium]|nr:PTS mannitol transporter subunit IICBA [Clostridia bacterium]MBQ3327717.1 PTS mannitol transporter subunit IICBA [Clostridia bacterium]MBQ6784282.1 PTS mannitol transporter subunit IICBA [Clostridia bacterium]MBR0364250.1 PTS mannitol transporter subunit IICBA [Clostridia bacterium]
MKNGLQRFGKFLSAMVMPNIGAFIAWGFITALFIADGWLPNERLASIQPYMLYYLIPVLIAGQGGYMVGGDRGRVMGAIAVMGTIAGVGGTEGQPMLLGAMVMGPLAGWCIKKFDQFMETRMPAGFEMLINNFSVGILGMLLAILGFYGIGPAMTAILAVLSAGVDVLVNHGLLPLAAIFIEPAKVLFLNNAINHGIFTPIGTEQALETGRSIMYMLEADPGPGLGVLLAYWAFAKDKMTKQSVPGAVIIHFFGGIHEIYFPYVLMNPLVIIAPIVGNMVAIFWFSLMKCGLVSPAAPGSIIAFLSMTPKDKMWQTIVGVLLATVVSFLIAAPIIKFTDKGKNLEDAQDQVAASKAQAKGAALAAGAGIADPSLVKKIIFACDAGMGSSAMGATKFRNRIKELRPDITVTNTSVDNIPADCDIAVVQEMLIDRAQKSAPQAEIVSIGNFLADPALDVLFEKITSDPVSAVTESMAMEAAAEEKAAAPAEPKPSVMHASGILLQQPSVTKETAIRLAGKLLVDEGCVEPPYVEAMLDREKVFTTYMGMGIAIPHGTSEAKAQVKKTGITLVQFPEGVDFGDEKANLVFGIAGIGDEHLDMIQKIVQALDDPAALEKMKTTDDVDWILEKLS